MAGPSLDLDRWMFANGYKYTTGGIRKFGVVVASPVEFEVFLHVRAIKIGGKTRDVTYNLGSLHMCTLENRHKRTNVQTVIKSSKSDDIYFSEFEGTLGGIKETLG